MNQVLLLNKKKSNTAPAHNPDLLVIRMSRVSNAKEGSFSYSLWWTLLTRMLHSSFCFFLEGDFLLHNKLQLVASYCFLQGESGRKRHSLISMKKKGPPRKKNLDGPLCTIYNSCMSYCKCDKLIRVIVAV